MIQTNVNVYIGGENPAIDCRTLDVALNPIVVRIGGKYDTNAVQVLMRRDQAEAMARAILAQLQGDDEESRLCAFGLVHADGKCRCIS